MIMLAQRKRLANCLRVFQSVLVIVLIFFLSSESFSNSPNKFNQLILAKNFLEFKFGIRSVECFPFKENIGFTEDQIPLIEQCLAGVQLFKLALGKIAQPEIFSVGISTRFLRTRGFNTVLVPWNASVGEVVFFCERKYQKWNRTIFLKKYRLSNVK